MDGTDLLLAAGGLILVAVVFFAVRTGERARADSAAQVARLAETAEKLATAQAVLAGRFGEAQVAMNERLESLSKRLGDGLSEHTEKTGETLRGLHERLAVIDAAQKNIAELSSQVVGLQDILGNKQARGAFGEVRLQDLVQDALPPAAYEFQATLTNGRRADCLIRLPNPPGAIAIDAKFPLESFAALRDARDDEARKQAERAVAADVRRHVQDIAGKYIVPGETAEWALMFLPSEAVYAELQANFRPVIEESHRLRVAIVSPTTLWGTLNTVRAVLKDAHMREQAGLIQAEVRRMLDDVGRLDKRAGNLQRHFEQATEDLKEIRTSAEKVARRGERIEEMQLGEEAAGEELPAPAQRLGAP